MEKVPLFINRFSLSPRTAIGVQTLRLLGPHADWLHFHWWSNGLRQLDRRSILFENTLLSRYSFLHDPRLLKVCERLGIGAWVGSDLRPAHAKRLTAEYQERVSKAYIAPLDEGDATRCLKLLNLVRVPFVLHLWDVLEGDIHQGALRELIDRAERVCCVSDPLVADVSRIRSDVELLSFSRDASQAKAKAPQEGPLRIVMHGNVSSYVEGLHDLDQALTLLENRGVPFEVTFLGSPKILRQANTTLKRRVQALGFFTTQPELDLALARAHVAFLPGPKLDPGVSMRSRYSIPSRILDYLAIGLPIVGTVNVNSATGGFLSNLGLGDEVTCTSPVDIAGWLEQLAEPGFWTEQSARSTQAFRLLEHQEAPPEKLKRMLDKIA